MPLPRPALVLAVLLLTQIAPAAHAARARKSARPPARPKVTAPPAAPAVAAPVGPAMAGSASGLEQRIDLALRQGGLRGARVGILVADLVTGETLYQRNPDDPLTPASLTKIVTSAAALDTLKPQYRFRTVLYGTGTLAAGTWKGDVYLKAYGDPDLIEERVWALVNDLRKRGLRGIQGDLLVDDTFFDRERFGEDWGPRSRSWYNAPHGAVSVNYNTLEVRGRYLAIHDDPTEHAGRFFVEMMKREGIELTGSVRPADGVPDKAVVLASSESKPLTEIVSDLNKVSNNFIAEQILKTLGAETQGAPGTADKGLGAVRAYLRRLNVPDGAHCLNDGSGLSHSNRLTARTLVTVLSTVVRDFLVGPEFLASLRVAGAEGKGKRFTDPLCQRRMRVKTGHLYGVAGLAGFAETVGGRRLVFAVLANDYRRGRYAADRGIEEVCEAFLGLDAPDGALLARDVLASPEPPLRFAPTVVGPDGMTPDEEEMGELEEGD